MSVPDVHQYEEVVYETDRFVVKLIKESPQCQLVDDISQYNYAVIHKERGTIEGYYQKCADAYSVAEQLEFHLRTKSYKINDPTPRGPNGGGKGPLRVV